MGAAAGAFISIPTFTPPSLHSHSIPSLSPSSSPSPTTSPSTLPSPPPAFSCSRPRRVATQQLVANNRPSPHRHHQSGAYPSRRTLLHIAPRRAARARTLCPAARGAAAAASAVLKTLSPAAAAAAASEMPSPALATPMQHRHRHRHRHRPRPRACATLGARPTLFPRLRSALYSTRRSRSLVAVRLRATLNGSAPSTLMPLSPVCPAGFEVSGTSIDCERAPS